VCCMSSMLAKHAYLDANGTVVQVISGAVDGVAHDALLRDYGILYGAVSCVRVEDETPVWIGGSYTDNQFLPPQVVQGTSEESPPLEVPDDALPG